MSSKTSIIEEFNILIDIMILFYQCKFIKGIVTFGKYIGLCFLYSKIIVYFFIEREKSIVSSALVVSAVMVCAFKNPVFKSDCVHLTESACSFENLMEDEFKLPTMPF